MVLEKKFAQMAECSDVDDDGLLVKVKKTEKEQNSKKPKKSLKINDVKLDEGTCSQNKRIFYFMFFIF